MGDIARTKGLELIVSKIKEVNIKNYPVIFMGDFNTEPNETRLLNLKKKCSIVEIFLFKTIRTIRYFQWF